MNRTSERARSTSAHERQDSLAGARTHNRKLGLPLGSSYEQRISDERPPCQKIDAVPLEELVRPHHTAAAPRHDEEELVRGVVELEADRVAPITQKGCDRIGIDGCFERDGG